MDIQKIANACNISTSAVYKALYHKKGVDAATREKVFAVCDSIPRAKVGRKKSVGVVLPANPSYYWDALYRGIQDALSPDIEAHFAFFSSLGSGNEGLHALEYVQDLDLCIIAPSNAPAVQAKIAALSAKKPIVYVSEGLPTPHLATVCSNYYDDGRSLGAALTTHMPKCKRVLALHVHNGLGSQTRTNGFLSVLQENNIELVGNIELEDIEKPFASVIARAIRDAGTGSFDCLYCATGVTPYACLALCKLRLDKNVICIGYENPPGNAPYTKSGLIRILAVSNAYEMGKSACMLAQRYLLSGETPPNSTIEIPSEIFVNK